MSHHPILVFSSYLINIECNAGSLANYYVCLRTCFSLNTSQNFLLCLHWFFFSSKNWTFFILFYPFISSFVVIFLIWLLKIRIRWRPIVCKALSFWSFWRRLSLSPTCQQSLSVFWLKFFLPLFWCCSQ